MVKIHLEKIKFLLTNTWYRNFSNVKLFEEKEFFMKSFNMDKLPDNISYLAQNCRDLKEKITPWYHKGKRLKKMYIPIGANHLVSDGCKLLTIIFMCNLEDYN